MQKIYEKQKQLNYMSPHLGVFKTFPPNVIKISDIGNFSKKAAHFPTRKPINNSSVE